MLLEGCRLELSFPHLRVQNIDNGSPIDSSPYDVTERGGGNSRIQIHS